MVRDGGAAGEKAAKQEKAAAKKKTPSLDNESFRPEVDDETRRQSRQEHAENKANGKGKEVTVFFGILLCGLALTTVERAVAYLSKEVPRWRTENGCFSCHNNGDAARALYLAGVAKGSAALAETTAWLANPGQWDSNKGNPAVSDEKLARIQFGAALLASGNKEAVCAAAGLIEKDRGANGSWTVDAGSPATYGTVLATYFARQVLQACGRDTAITAAWFVAQKPGSVLEAAALLLASPGRVDARAYLVAARTSDGGWGEYPGMPAQVFDTAIAVIALRGDARGRAWLTARQQAEGGWPETTRPAGSQSYAQHISTTAWALMALLDVPTALQP